MESLRKERDMLKMVECKLNQEKVTILSQQRTQNLLLTNLQTIQVYRIYSWFFFFFPSPKQRNAAQNSNFMFFQASLERSETETRQRLNNQLEKQEREISQLQKRLEHEAEQRHLLSRNQEVRQN